MPSDCLVCRAVKWRFPWPGWRSPGADAGVDGVLQVAGEGDLGLQGVGAAPSLARALLTLVIEVLTSPSTVAAPAAEAEMVAVAANVMFAPPKAGFGR